MNKAEKNYSTIEKELLAIVFGIKHFSCYLYKKKFIVYTDHRPLIYLFGMANPSSRLTKYRLLIKEYDFNIRYIKEKENVIADALSRITMNFDELKNMFNMVSATMFAITRQQSKNVEDRASVSNLESERIDQPDAV